MIKTGRYGQVLYDPLGVTPVAVLSLNKWKVSQKTNKTNVTCFLDTNKVYVPGLPDISGTISGFWNSAETTLFEAVQSETPGMLELVPNSTEAEFKWSGLAYLDAEIDTGVEGAPAVSGSFMAAGPWTFATGLPLTRHGDADPAAAYLAGTGRPGAGLMPPGPPPQRRASVRAGEGI